MLLVSFVRSDAVRSCKAFGACILAAHLKVCAAQRSCPLACPTKNSSKKFARHLYHSIIISGGRRARLSPAPQHISDGAPPPCAHALSADARCCQKCLGAAACASNGIWHRCIVAAPVVISSIIISDLHHHPVCTPRWQQRSRNAPLGCDDEAHSRMHAC